MPYPDNFNSAAFDRHYGTPEDDALIERVYDDLLRDIMADPKEFVIDWFFESDQYLGDGDDKDYEHYTKQAREWAKARLNGTVNHMPALEAAFSPAFEQWLEVEIDYQRGLL